jgi:hypothetical protein
MEYSYWSGVLQGSQEKLMEEFNNNPTAGNALHALLTVMKMRSDFVYYRKKGMVTGDLPPFDTRLIGNIFAGLKNSIKINASDSEPN